MNQYKVECLNYTSIETAETLPEYIRDVQSSVLTEHPYLDFQLDELAEYEAQKLDYLKDELKRYPEDKERIQEEMRAVEEHYADCREELYSSIIAEMDVYDLEENECLATFGFQANNEGTIHSTIWTEDAQYSEELWDVVNQIDTMAAFQEHAESSNLQSTIDQAKDVAAKVTTSPKVQSKATHK